MARVLVHSIGKLIQDSETVLAVFCGKFKIYILF